MSFPLSGSACECSLLVGRCQAKARGADARHVYHALYAVHIVPVLNRSPDRRRNRQVKQQIEDVLGMAMRLTR